MKRGVNNKIISYDFPEEEIFNDATLTDVDKVTELSKVQEEHIKKLKGLFSSEKTVEETRTLDVDILALVLFWSETDVVPPVEHGGSKYNYWCNILRDHARWHDTSDTRYNPDYNFDDVVMTPLKKHIEQSEKIIDYYKLKLSHRALTGDISFSEYETKLGSFINSLPGQFKFEELGVIVRLPETYNVDLIFDGLIEKYDSLPPAEDVRLTYEEPYERKSFVLNFIRKVNILGSRENNIRYYFENDNILYCMRFGENNSLLNVLDHVLETKNNTLKISASITPSVLYANSNFWYNTIHEGFVIE